MGAKNINRTVVVAVHPGHDTSVVVGPYWAQAQLDRAVANLNRKGWNTECCELRRLGEVPTIR